MIVAEILLYCHNILYGERSMNGLDARSHFITLVYMDSYQCDNKVHEFDEGSKLMLYLFCEPQQLDGEKC